MRIITTVTIDTEADSDIKWSKKNPPTFASVHRGINAYLRPIFDKLKINPVYFVCAEVLEDEQCCRVLKNESGLGAEIATHLHGEEIDPHDQASAGVKTFAHRDYTDEEEFEKIRYCTQLIKEKISTEPKSFRAGRFAADINTMRSLGKLGYCVDSSVTPNIDWSSMGGMNFKGFPHQPYFIDLDENDYKNPVGKSGLLEVPLTIGKKKAFFLPEKWYFYEWLRPSNMLFSEELFFIQRYLHKRRKEDIVVLCLMFHSMEIIPKATPYVRTGFEQKLYLGRLYRTLQFLKLIGSEFMTLKEIHSIFKKHG